VTDEPDFLAAERAAVLDQYAAGLVQPSATPSPNGTRAEDRVPASGAVTARLRPGGSFVLDAPETVPAVWGRDDQVLWAAGEPLLICGPAGVGKTTVACQLVAARLGDADGGPVEVLGLPVVPGDTGKKVLYLASDRPRQVQRAMRRLFREDDRGLLDERLVVWPGPPPVDFARVPETLLMLAEEANADTIVIDSLKDVALGLNTDEGGAGLNNAIQRALVEGIEVAGLHHQRKGAHGEKPKGLADVYGSTWITAGAGSVILLWGEAGDPLVELSHLKQPAAAVGPWTIEHDHTAGRSSVSRGFELMRFLRNRRAGATAKEVARAWFEKAEPDDNQRKRAERALKRAVANGVVHREGGAARFGDSAEGVRYFAVETLRAVPAGGAS
jgi:hypothetical protein